MKLPNIHIITEDTIFSSIIYRLLLNRFGKINFTQSHNLFELKSNSSGKVYDAVLLDNFIAGTSQFELLAYLRNNKEICAPILYFTNNTLDENGALAAGATKVINKPFVPDGLVDQIQFFTTLVNE
ncbi:PleD family two-component system response regulator [Saccharicrinis aurantiacus]|uniref:response regulator n=1 Tax=Saccharicrinis aurantiacus TaxID=1849719 RepID=UPI000838C80A|nr:response regulator [Saccharicrinis aurantiacus]